MSRKPKDPKLMRVAEDLVKNIKTEKDLSSLTSDLVKMTIEAAMKKELEEHLGYSTHSAEGHNSGNSRNGHSSKTIMGNQGDVQIDVPRDRNSDFEPQIVQKGQRRLTVMDEQIMALYSKGMTTRDIVATFKEMYGAEVSPSLISRVTESVYERVIEWQARPLDETYPIMFLDGITVKIRQDKRVVKKTFYLALGINLEGRKELLGLWLGEAEGAKFWLSVLTELRNRGVKDVFIMCMDGLKGLPEAVESVYPKASVQLCIVHMVRNSLRFVSWKDRKAVASDLKRIYTSINETEARRELEKFGEAWDSKYPTIRRQWERHWSNMITLFDYPDEIRKVIYTTNAIESLNSVIAKAFNNRKVFPTDESAMKVVFLAAQAASKKWSMPIRYWKPALNQLLIMYKEENSDN